MESEGNVEKPRFLLFLGYQRFISQNWQYQTAIEHFPDLSSQVFMDVSSL